ncbi:UNVERIFIED_CONTAM: hypothetical protein NCL1_51159 [Trichonephila clavipes]
MNFNINPSGGLVPPENAILRKAKSWRRNPVARQIGNLLYVRESVNVNVALSFYTRAFRNGPGGASLRRQRSSAKGEITWSFAKSPRVAEQCDVNLHSLTHSLIRNGPRHLTRTTPAPPSPHSTSTLTIGKLVHVETNYEGLVKTIWLEFPDLTQIRKKLRCKAEDYAAEINVSRIAVSIVLRFSNIPLNHNKTIFVKCTQFPLVCACTTTTIHKSQDSTYSEIVDKYDRRQSQSLLYVALSRVTSIEGLYTLMSIN